MIGCTVYFYEKIKFLILKLLFKISIGSLKSKNFIFSRKYTVWPIKCKEITSGVQKYCQKLFSTYLDNFACKIRCKNVNFWFFSKSAR